MSSYPARKSQVSIAGITESSLRHFPSFGSVDGAFLFSYQI